MSTFTATFVYSAAGLFTVGVEAGVRTEVFPRLAVSGAIVLHFLSLGMVVYFADHLAHSIQIDAVMRRVERNTRRALAHEDTANVEEVAPAVAWLLSCPISASSLDVTMRGTNGVPPKGERHEVHDLELRLAAGLRRNGWSGQRAARLVT